MVYREGLDIETPLRNINREIKNFNEAALNLIESGEYNSSYEAQIENLRIELARIQGDIVKLIR